MTRVGILGGTFDPPHVAHGAMARAARDTLALDRVLLMPAPQPPHKVDDAGDMTPFDHRVAMAALEARDADGVEVSRFEERRRGPSYTVDLLRDYARENPAQLYFIMGADSFADLPQWRDPEGILALCTVVVFMRTGYPVRLRVDGAASVVVFEEPVIDVSSTDVRRRLRGGEPVEALVSPAVLSYIANHRLYR